jgi:DNA-binding MarR family transcriptional regulator
MDQDNQSSRENRRRERQTEELNERLASETRDRDERLALLDRIGDLSRKSQSATDLFDERVGDFLGVNRTDGRCLDIIGRHEKVSAGTLAIEAGLTTGAVTAGYVQRVRDPVDRRKVWVECTPHTNQITETIFGVYDLLGPIMIEHFTNEQLEGILAFLEIGSRVNQELAAGIQENTQPRAAVAERLKQARQFRRAIDAGSARLAAELERLAPPVDKK